jgi:hypothetical protein
MYSGNQAGTWKRMNKLQKIGAWIWNNKERMVLAVMLAVFAYRFYQIWDPPPPQNWERLRSPMQELPEEPEARQELGLPSNPGPKPPMNLPGDYVSFYERNPFWYYSGQMQQNQNQEVRAEDLGIELIDIQDVQGKPRARLKTSRTNKWYSEAEQFEEFEVQQIDPEASTVVVFSERHSKSFTLKKR